MGLKRVFRRKGEERPQSSTQAELAALLEHETGDPAFIHQAEWVTAYGNKDFDAALEAVDRALQVSPGSARYLALRAMTNYQMDRYGEARADVSAALAAEPSQKEALDLERVLQAAAMESRDRARELGKEGRNSDAVAELTTAIALEPENPLGFFFRGLTRAQIGDLSGAITDLEQTLVLDPSYPDAEDMLERVKSMAAEDPSPSDSPKESGSRHYFIASGNPSVIDAIHDTFNEVSKAAGVAASCEFARFHASNDDLEARRPQAAEAGVAFSGTRYLGTDSDPADDFDGVLSSLSRQGTAGVHLATASVASRQPEWVEQIYDELLKQAMQQGIMPFPMFVTDSEEAARFLRDSLAPGG